MKTATELQNIIEELKRENEAREIENAKKHCDFIISPVIEKCASKGENEKTVVLPFNISVKEIEKYLIANGYTTEYKGNGNLLIKW